MLEGMADDAPQEMARLAALAKALEHARPVAGPAPFAFRNALRNRLLIEMATRKPWLERVRDSYSERNARMRRSFKFVFANAVAAVVLIAGGSIMAMASNAVPGDWDYWAKRTHENARLLVTRAAEPRAYLQMELARERLDEVRALVDRKQTDSGPYFQALNDMDLRTLDATSLLIGVYGRTQNRVPLDRLTSFAQAQRFGLEMIVDRLPAGARNPARDSLAILERVSQRVTGIVGGCLCPANALVPQASSGDDQGGAGTTPGSSTQAPVCACAQYRGVSSQGLTGDGNDSGKTPPDSGDPVQPPVAESPGLHVEVPSVDGTTVDDTVNELIDNLIEPLLNEPLVGQPTPKAQPSGIVGSLLGG
jgi:hypothetical protein